jgi:2-methylcitrate dehydratase
MDDIVSALADYTVNLDLEKAHADVRGEVRRRLVDSIACAYGALDSSPVVRLRQLALERDLPAGCLVWGTSQRTSPELAALVNGAAVRFLDFNDHIQGGHPSDNIPAIIAICEWVDGNVDDLTEGIVVNYEVFGELGRLGVKLRGWDQGTTGGIAAACAVGRVLKLSAPEMATAIGIAATSNISIRKPRYGQLTMWKGVATAYASQAGLIAASIASTGITAPHDVFRGKQGFCEQVSGPFEINNLLADDDPYHLFKASYKYWPVEFDAQPAVWLGRHIRDAIPLDTISHFDVEASEWAWLSTASDQDKWHPTTRETADHSLPFILAVALTHGSISIHHFSSTSITDPAYSKLMSRISVRASKDVGPETSGPTMRITVRRVNGESHTFQAGAPRGQYSNPISAEDLRRKWESLVFGTRFQNTAASMLALLETLDGSLSVRDLMAPLGAQSIIRSNESDPQPQNGSQHG